MAKVSRQDASNELSSVKFGSLGVSEVHSHSIKKHVYVLFKHLLIIKHSLKLIFKLPAISAEQFYSILDANEDMIFMHVDDEGDTGKGTIFTSDETGVIFSRSLENNLYPNGDDVTDFVRIESLNGVYITSQVLPHIIMYSIRIQTLESGGC